MAEETKSDEKKPMTYAERLELAQKLDQELDDFINSLESKQNTEGWSEDRWENRGTTYTCKYIQSIKKQKLIRHVKRHISGKYLGSFVPFRTSPILEEMDKHPFFTKSNPEGAETSSLPEGIAKLEFDLEENTPLELATNYKEDGNFNFKYKNYRLAILGYTMGIKVRSDDAEINASLYNNRAASHYHLKNFTSALFDSEKALKYNENHAKARLRAAKSAFEIAKYDTCIEHCQKLLEIESEDKKEVMELLNTAKNKKTTKECDERKKNIINSKMDEQKRMVMKAIIERGIRIWKCKDADDIDFSKLEPSFPGTENCIVHLEDGILKWPVLFIFPEYKKADFVKYCPENVPLVNQLNQLFPEPWDKDNKYKTSTVNVYFKGYKMPHIIKPSKNLGELLVTKYFELKAGTPAFYVVPRSSEAEMNFLESFW